MGFESALQPKYATLAGAATKGTPVASTNVSVVASTNVSTVAVPRPAAPVYASSYQAVPSVKVQPELIPAGMDVSNTVVFDVECYRNFFMVLFKVLSTDEVLRFQISPRRALEKDRLRRVLEKYQLIGFNSGDYDIPMIQLALSGYTVEQLKEVSDDIVVRRMRGNDIAKKYRLPRHGWNHIDLIWVAPLKASLKLYAGRLHCRKMQDLPVDPAAEINADLAETLAVYCLNDLDNTTALYVELSAQIELRRQISKQYGRDVRSRSDAQVAEQIIMSEVQKITGVAPGRAQVEVGKVYRYQVPDYVKYQLPQLQAALHRMREAEFIINDDGRFDMPRSLEGLVVEVNGGKYTVGLGGLHSAETCVMHQSTSDTLLVDRDVTSYYPSIVLNQGLYPTSMGPEFLTVYRSLVERRIAAKKAGDKVTAESLKIAVNGSFGKLANQFSVLYAPAGFLQITITGQLALLMLIEAIEGAGIPVVSANTDGVLIKCPTSNYALLNEVVASWEKATDFNTEETKYKIVCAKDVNNYIAVKEDGGVKGKGLYANPWEKPGPNIFKLQKNPSTTIVIDAVVGMLRDQIPLEQTICSSRDITKFIAVRMVKAGARDAAGDYLGKAIRWYYTMQTGGSAFSSQKNGARVPKSDGARPLMELPDEFPSDVNYEWYVREAETVLKNIGYVNYKSVVAEAQGDLFS